jgi:prevent-host-death family protein
MPEYIGVSVWKAKAGEIVRSVQQGKRYVVSVRGHPAALLIPVEPVPEAEEQDVWEELLRMRDVLAWDTEQSTAELLDEVRG